MRLFFLLSLLLGFSVPANAISDLNPLDMKLEQEGFSSLIAQEPPPPPPEEDEAQPPSPPSEDEGEGDGEED